MQLVKTPDAPVGGAFVASPFGPSMNHFEPDILGFMNPKLATPTAHEVTRLDAMLARSVELDATAMGILGSETFELCSGATNVMASFNACEVALEHARALRALISDGFLTTGAAVLRMQFEALVRAMWLLWAAHETELEKISAQLSPASEAAASKLPMVAKMIERLKDVGPPGAYEMVSGFKSTMLGGLNSFVHSGIHPLQRSRTGYPERLVAQVLQNSNAVFLMTTMLLANLSGDEATSKAMSKIQPTFSDCLPALLGPTSVTVRA